MKNLLTVFAYAKPFKKYIFLMCFLIVIGSIYPQVNPWIGKYSVDYIQKAVEGKLTSDEAINKITPLLLIALFASIINWAAARASWRFGQVFSEKFRGHLRAVALSHLLNLDIGFYDRQSSGNMMSKVDRGVNRMADQISEFTTFFIPNILAALIAIVLIVNVKWQFAALMVVAFIPFILINILAIRRHEPLQKKVNKLYDEEYGHFWEVISSIRLVKSFEKAKYEIAKLLRFNKKTNRLTLRIEKIWDLASVKDLFLTVWVWGLNVYLIVNTVNGDISLGTYFLLTQYTVTLREPLWNLTWLYFELRRVSIGAKGFVKILDTKAKVIDKPNARVLMQIKGKIEFNNVSFAYKKGKDVIKNLKFQVLPGETVAFVGKSGSGKTTIINLMNRFYDVSRGAIRIDGVDVRDIAQSSLRGNIGMVLQDSYLYDDTIAENLRYGGERAGEKDMIEACKMANAWEFIEKLPYRLNTRIGERGIKLSGGQKQRLSIARTILKNPKILILDEATSSLDSESELKVQNAIWNLISNRTTIMIAHRLSTIQKADRIFVLDNGRIREQGTHAELLKFGGIYAKLHAYQSSRKQELLLEEYEIE